MKVILTLRKLVFAYNIDFFFYIILDFNVLNKQTPTQNFLGIYAPQIYDPHNISPQNVLRNVNGMCHASGISAFAY